MEVAVAGSFGFSLVQSAHVCSTLLSVLTGATGLELVEDSQSTQGSSLEDVAGSTGFLLVVLEDEAQSSQFSLSVVVEAAGALVEVVAPSTGLVPHPWLEDVVEVDAPSTGLVPHPWLEEVVDVVAPSTGLVPHPWLEVVVEVVAPSTGLVPQPWLEVVEVDAPSTGLTLVEFQSSQVSRATLLCN